MVNFVLKSTIFMLFNLTFRSSRPQIFLRKDVLKICSTFTGKHPCRSVISIKLFWNFIEIATWHVCSPVNLLHISRKPFPKNTYERLLQYIVHDCSRRGYRTLSNIKDIAFNKFFNACKTLTTFHLRSLMGSWIRLHALRELLEGPAILRFYSSSLKSWLRKFG